MKGPGFFAMPWDLVVFLTIATVGLGFSVQRLQLPFSQEGRGPAAEIRTGSVGMDLSQRGSMYIDLGCIERRIGRERVSSQQGTMRIKGRFCNLSRKAMRAFGGAQVKNLTNGHEGTIFFHGAGNSFISDSVPLEKGKNVIQVEWRETRETNAREFLTEVFEK